MFQLLSKLLGIKVLTVLQAPQRIQKRPVPGLGCRHAKWGAVLTNCWSPLEIWGLSLAQQVAQWVQRIARWPPHEDRGSETLYPSSSSIQAQAAGPQFWAVSALEKA